MWFLHTRWQIDSDKAIRGKLPKYKKRRNVIKRQDRNKLSEEDNTGVGCCHTIHLQSGSVVCHASWTASCTRIVATMTSTHWCYYQYTDTVPNLGSCYAHVGGEFTSMETPWQLQGTVALWHVASQLGIITWIGFPIEWKWDDVGEDWVKQYRKL